MHNQGENKLYFVLKVQHWHFSFTYNAQNGIMASETLVPPSYLDEQYKGTG